MKPIRRIFAVAAVAVLGCTDSVTEPQSPAIVVSTDRAAPPMSVGVLSRNLYVGTDLDMVLAALTTENPDDDFPALLAALEILGATDFARRAESIADEIAKADPLVIGLQEVSRMTVDLTPLGVPVSLTLDFEPLLYSALAARGLDYVVAAQNINIEFDALPGPPTVAVRDKDVMLIRGDVIPQATGNKSYDICLSPVPGSCPITIPYPVPVSRGYVWARILIDEVPWTFVSTHPESGAGADQSAIRSVQIAELVSTFAAAPGPVVMMGDFNDRPEEDGWPTPDGYDLITSVGGFTDFWSARHPGVAGLTCCYAPDLSSRLPSVLYERIDFIFVRDVPGRALGRITRLGATPASRIDGPAYPIWPSDHVGLAAEILVPPGLAR